MTLKRKNQALSGVAGQMQVQEESSVIGYCSALELVESLN